MTAQIAQLAKLSAPQLAEIVPRPRLYQNLLRAAEFPLIWIVAPPGAGKTTLVAGFLSEVRRPAQWYQVERDDSDPASCFYYLKAARAASIAGAAPLPPQLKVDEQDVARFARQFFGAYFSGVPLGTAFVFDNYQRAESGLACANGRSLFEVEGISQIPPGVSVFVLSHRPPPAALVRLVANRQLLLLDWPELQFTAQEVRELAQDYGLADSRRIDELTGRAGGWAAGLTLLLERWRREPALAFTESVSPGEEVFEYFAHVVFQYLPPEAQHLLSHIAYLQDITPEAAADLSGSSEAGAQLARLHQSRFFIACTQGPQPTYRLHGLLQTFLQREVQRRLGAEQRRGLARRSVAWLIRQGNIEEAARLLCELGAWEGLRDLLNNMGDAALNASRRETVLEWVALFPEPLRIADPWLLYWQGRAYAFVDPNRSEELLLRSLAAFKQLNDTQWAISACMSGLGSRMLLLAGENYSVFVDELSALISSGATLLTHQQEINLFSVAAKLLSELPDHPLVDLVARRSHTLLQQSIRASERLQVGSFALEHSLWQGDLGQIPAIINEVEQELGYPAAIAEPYLHWLHLTHLYHLCVGDFARAEERLEEGRALALQVGAGSYQVLFAHFSALQSIELGKADAATTWVNELVGLARTIRFHPANFELLKAGVAFVRGDWAIAERGAANALELGKRVASVGKLDYHAALAIAQSIQGKFASAKASLERVHALTKQVGQYQHRFSEELFLAYYHLCRDELPRADAHLRAALAAMRTRGYMTFSPWWIAEMMSHLCARALESGIEVEFVRTLIARRGLRPPSPETEDWPWPIKIYTLGRFALVINETPLRPSGKAQTKPTDLLKCLIACGGREISALTLIAALWPDSEGDAGQTTLDSTVHRLRKLLSDEAAILVSDGRLSVNRQVVWVDVWAFERMLGKYDAIVGRQGNERHAHLEEVSRAVRRLYQGHFLALDGEQPWMLGMQEKLRSKWLRHLVGLGRHLEASGDWDKAAELYQRGLELDHLDEELYRRLMTTYLRRGEPAGALEVYRQCRQMLSVVLGIKPSAATERLYQILKDG